MPPPKNIQKNIALLQEIFPSCVTEAKGDGCELRRVVDFNKLRQELTTEFITDGTEERYHLNWPGKQKALHATAFPIDRTLRPNRRESEQFDTTKNLFIEGENLETLKLLEKSYIGKIKMIYIDPPYNTGSDFIFRDNFTENAEEYLKKTNQMDEDGYKLFANTESNGRFHSHWLSMIYPRLKLARNLLRDDGSIFVSIGIEELSNLKLLMDEVFGEFNFIELFSWVKTSTPPTLSKKSRKTNEYVLCYEKCRHSIKYRGEILEGGDQPLLNTGNQIKKIVFPKDKVQFRFINNGKITLGRKGRINLLQDLEIENGYAKENFSMSGEFKWTQDFLNQEVEKGTTFVIKSDKFSIRFIRTGTGYKPPTNFIGEKYTSPVIDKKTCDVGTNETASSQLRELLGSDVFSHPKPVSLIEYLLNFVVDDNDIVMDFFAGSGTTAEAVFNYAKKQGINVNFILVQLPENLDSTLSNTTDSNTKQSIKNAIDLLDQHNLPHNLAELAKLRIKIAGEAIQRTSLSDSNSPDIGFRVLKVDSSGMVNVNCSPANIDQSEIKVFAQNIKSDREPEDLLFQVLIKLGMDLSLPITKESIAGKSVLSVNKQSYELVACFDTNINEKFARELALLQPQRVVFRDTNFESDAIKINVEQIFKQTSPTTKVFSI